MKKLFLIFKFVTALIMLITRPLLYILGDIFNCKFASDKTNLL